jgi:hypothetical protein
MGMVARCDWVVAMAAKTVFVPALSARQQPVSAEAAMIDCKERPYTSDNFRVLQLDRKIDLGRDLIVMGEDDEVECIILDGRKYTASPQSANDVKQETSSKGRT